MGLHSSFLFHYAKTVASFLICYKSLPHYTAEKETWKEIGPTVPSLQLAPHPSPPCSLLSIQPPSLQPRDIICPTMTLIKRPEMFLFLFKIRFQKVIFFALHP